MAGCVAAKELRAKGLLQAQVWSAEGPCILRHVWWLGTPECPHVFQGPWSQGGVSLTWSTEGPPCPTGIHRFFAIVCSFVCEETELFGDFCRKVHGVFSVFRKLYTHFPKD